MSKTCIVFDLDDTLYKEIEFLKSGYKYIVNKLPLMEKDQIYENMLQKYKVGEDVFNYVQQLLPEFDKSVLLQWYRSHKPDIHLDDNTLDCLKFLKTNNVILGLISDGRSVTQRNKIEALGLNELILDEDIVISEELGSEKPSEINYQYIAQKHPGCSFFYVGDNPKKDFIAPNKLGWKTIGLRDNGQNIHPQSPGVFEPQIWINDITEIKKFI